MTTSLPHKLKAIIFDMDGLMFNTEDLYRKVTTEMGERRGKAFTDELHRNSMGRSNLKSLQVIQEYWNLPESAEELQDERDALIKMRANTDLRRMKGLDDVLIEANRLSLRKIIVTGSSLGVVEHFLQVSDLKDEFEFIVTGADVINGKPHPDIYVKALHILELPANECIVLEDSINGVRSAHAASIMVFAVPNKYSDPSSFTDADEIFDSLEGVADLLKSI